MESLRPETAHLLQALDAPPLGVSPLIRRAQKYALEYLQSSRCRYLPFHNAQHTWEVFLNVSLLGGHEALSASDLEPVLLAALFHDLGNAICFEGHEQHSMALAKDYLSQQGYAWVQTKRVMGCIEATQMPQNPKNPLECLLCDADLFHLGTSDFMAKNTALRKEWKEYQQREFSDEAWNRLNRSFLEQHRYVTPYGRQILEPGKKRNIRLLRQKQQKPYK